MQKFTTLTTTACPIEMVNLNTDQLIPVRFLKLPRSAGLGKFLLHDLRYDAQGHERKTVAGKNQGGMNTNAKKRG